MLRMAAFFGAYYTEIVKWSCNKKKHAKRDCMSPQYRRIPARHQKQERITRNEVASLGALRRLHFVSLTVAGNLLHINRKRISAFTRKSFLKNLLLQLYNSEAAVFIVIGCAAVVDDREHIVFGGIDYRGGGKTLLFAAVGVEVCHCIGQDSTV